MGIGAYSGMEVQGEAACLSDTQKRLAAVWARLVIQNCRVSAQGRSTARFPCVLCEVGGCGQMSIPKKIAKSGAKHCLWTRLGGGSTWFYSAAMPEEKRL